MDQIQRLIDYIEVVNKGHAFAPDDKRSLYVDFKSFYTQYDARRGKNLIQTFPELEPWYSTIQIPKVFPIKQLGKDGIRNFEAGVYEP
jgi:hypothetical protein